MAGSVGRSPFLVRLAGWIFAQRSALWLCFFCSLRAWVSLPDPPPRAPALFRRSIARPRAVLACHAEAASTLTVHASCRVNVLRGGCVRERGAALGVGAHACMQLARSLRALRSLLAVCLSLSDAARAALTV